jgi:hypothetical protein
MQPPISRLRLLSALHSQPIRSQGRTSPAEEPQDVEHEQMQVKRKFSPVRVAAASQVGSVGLAVWFCVNTGNMSCQGSGQFAGFTLLVHTVICVLLIAAIIFEREWRLMIIPPLSWLVVYILVGLFVH